jgi:hypothetical protein
MRNLATPVLLALFFRCTASAQGFHMHLTYVCNGERIYVESCNGSEDSDSTRCMIGHKDKIVNGFMMYSSDTVGALKKFLPTCKQPSAEDIARMEALQKKQHDLNQAQQQKTDTGMANFTKPVEGFNTGGTGVNESAQTTSSTTTARPPNRKPKRLDNRSSPRNSSATLVSAYFFPKAMMEPRLRSWWSGGHGTCPTRLQSSKPWCAKSASTVGGLPIQLRLATPMLELKKAETVN